MSINKLPIEASLKEVMDKFEEISLIDLSKIDIVVKNELPSIVKNGQIVVISNKVPNKILLDFVYPLNSSENDIYINLNREVKGKIFKVIDKIKTINTYIFGAEQYIGGSYKRVESYIGENGVWVSMNKTYLFDNGDICEDVSGGWEFSSRSYGTRIIEYRNNSIYGKAKISGNNTETTWVKANSKKMIDMAQFSSLNVQFSTTDFSTGYFIMSILDSTGQVITSKNIQANPENEKIVSLDISNVNVNSSIQLKFETDRKFSYNTSNSEGYITSVWLA